MSFRAADYRYTSHLLSVSFAVLAAWIIADRGVGTFLLKTLGTGDLLLFCVSGLAFLGLRYRGIPVFGALNPAVGLASGILALAFALGVALAGTELGESKAEITQLFIITVLCLTSSGAVTQYIFRPARAPISVLSSQNAFERRTIQIVILVGIAAAVANMVTGEIPLLSSNVNASRLGGSAGILSQAWVWLIGLLEWTSIFAIAVCTARRSMDRLAVLYGGGALILLLLLAGRSFLVLVLIGATLAALTIRKLPLSLLVTAAILLLLGLGVFSVFRSQHSPAAGSGASNDSVLSTIRRSITIGPAVFASTIDSVPDFVHFQNGGFLTRDLRATFPAHPWGYPERSDYWVTSAIRHRSTSDIGGSPPTLTGGLYIDFGVPGVIFGSLALGGILSLSYVLAARTRLMSAVVLYSYLGAYVIVSAYSYVSIKPQLVAVVMVSALAFYLERGAQDRATVSPVDSRAIPRHPAAPTNLPT